MKKIVVVIEELEHGITIAIECGKQKDSTLGENMVARLFTGLIKEGVDKTRDEVATLMSVIKLGKAVGMDLEDEKFMEDMCEKCEKKEECGRPIEEGRENN